MSASVKRELSEIDVRVGKRLRARRLELDLSQVAVADQLGISFQQVQKYENGRNRISASRLREVSSILNVHPSYFFEVPQSTDIRVMRQIESFISSKQGMSLVRALLKIKDADTRHAIVAFIAVIAGKKF
jgi:transcriptional regulator with XRE-family HTH domain